MKIEKQETDTGTEMMNKCPEEARKHDLGRQAGEYSPEGGKGLSGRQAGGEKPEKHRQKQEQTDTADAMKD